jgi:hypothetical protein
MNRRRTPLVLCAVLMTLGGRAAEAAPAFERLEDPLAGFVWDLATAVSGDGRTTAA